MVFFPICSSMLSGDRYYQYEFKHQPSHEECFQMINSSPSILFKSYTNLYCDYNWENLFTLLFQGSKCVTLTLPSFFLKNVEVKYVKYIYICIIFYTIIWTTIYDSKGLLALFILVY